ncbi:hypothetical protein QNH28_12970 [Paenibacillus sp. G2S3]|uniref:hypothetical protein n=1 Tax=Paenibacillus sp. G2S3 TaxID=3047872 RepID=UPI0024C14D4F|nr:hypothetical protein [Paenibacillus sp. G2S3]WHY21833.1 hypothetical protein QNH28_12970 [Paenibacillus sp. G2S3]
MLIGISSIIVLLIIVVTVETELVHTLYENSPVEKERISFLKRVMVKLSAWTQ